MDPFSITAGAIGIAGTAVTSIVQLHSLIDSLEDANDVIQNATSDLGSIEQSIAALEHFALANKDISNVAQADLTKAGVAEAVNKMGLACDDFDKRLTKWTRHSSTEKLSLRDRISVGVWNKEKIRTFETQLQSCKSTVQLAVSSTQLRVQLRPESLDEVVRGDVMRRLQGIEKYLQQHLGASKQQLVLAQQRNSELEEEPEDEEDGGAQRTLAVREVEDRERVLEADHVSSGVMLSQVSSTLSGLEIGDFVTPNYSKAFVGLPESVIGKINTRIGNVTTTDNSRGHVRVLRGDLKCD
ncbi:hypothetical protein NX059_001392 [Plenodomus lindquistii]|nr:hypothetical protein NX059_001392 [Plenodomus lindquistii]